MGDWGIKISQDGVDVKTATDDQLVMSSEFNLLKTKATGTVTGTGVKTVEHGLAYKPIFLTTELTGVAGRYTIAGSAENYAGVDATYLYMGVSGVSITARYYIFYEQAI